MFCVRQGGVGFNDHAVERTLAVEYVLRCISSPLLTFDLGAKLDVETVRAFLEFLYTDEIIDMPNAAVKQLLALARQYNLPRLIAICRGSNFTATLADDLWSMSSPSSPSVFIVCCYSFLPCTEHRTSPQADAEIDTPDGFVQAHKVVLAARMYVTLECTMNGHSHEHHL